MPNGFGFIDWLSWPSAGEIGDAVDLARQGIRIFVPGIGIVEGAVEAGTSGSPTGAAEFFVPALGIVKGVVEGTPDFLRLAGEPAKNAAMSTATLLLLLGAFGVLALVIWKK